MLGLNASTLLGSLLVEGAVGYGLSAGGAVEYELFSG